MNGCASKELGKVSTKVPAWVGDRQSNVLQQIRHLPVDALAVEVQNVVGHVGGGCVELGRDGRGDGEGEDEDEDEEDTTALRSGQWSIDRLSNSLRCSALRPLAFAPTAMASRSPLKILMLHGYTQSGPIFHAKTRALAKHLQKSFPLHEVSLCYPTGPLRLNPADIPGYTPSSETEPQEIEAYGWWRRSSTSEPPEYTGLDDGLSCVADVLRREGPFDGVIGFSQGAALAAMVASLLEHNRMDSFVHFADAKTASEGFELPAGPVPGIPFPSSFNSSSLSHPPFKFVLCYSGFRAPGPRYRAFYERPPIQTPVLHVLGSLDAVVDESRSRALVDACTGNPEKDGKVVWHPGGHFLPSQRAYLDAAVLFIRRYLEGENGDKCKKPDENVEDMDLPF